ncbi:MAG: hypothetical protein AAFU67_13820, partial [Bacteroidota bacterium]
MSHRHRIAVLPFKNLGGDSLGILSEGLSDLSIETLREADHYLVIVKESTKQLTTFPVPEVFQILNADLLLTGELWMNDQLELRLQLWERNSIDLPKWEAIIQSDKTQMFQLGNQLVEELNTRLCLSPQRTQKLPSNRQAYRSFLQGNHFLNKWERGCAELAMVQFEKVMDLEPDFVPAYLGYAKSAFFLAGRGFRPAKELYPRVNALLDHMIRFRPDYGELFIYKGIVQFFYELNWVAAYENMERGLGCFSAASEAYAQLSYFWYGMREYDKAIDCVRIALEYNPLSTALINMLGDIQLSAERYQEATATFKHILELNPDDKVAFENLMYIAALQGQARKTRHYLRLLTLDGTATVADYPRLAFAYARLGMERETTTTLKALLADTSSGQRFGRLANLYTGKQDWEAAMGAIEQVFQSRYGLLYFLTDPQFRLLRSWKRYQNLEQQIRIPTCLRYGNEIRLQTDLKNSINIDPNKLLYLRADEKYVE